MKKLKGVRSLRVLAVAFVMTRLVTACGGGGSDTSSVIPAPAPSATTSLTGVASKGPLKKAKVTAFAVDANGAVGSTALATVVSGDAGEYTLNLGGYAGAVQLVVTTSADTRSADEATGTDLLLPSDFALRANTVVNAPTVTTTQSASITPFTELANNIAKASGGITAASIANANGVVFNLIGVDPVATVPLNSTATPLATATDAQKRYALFNAAVSKLAASVPVTTDAATLKCFTEAATDAGKKIQCAITQIANAVTTTSATGGAAAGTAANAKLVGLAAALVSAAADTRINQTGTTITANDSAANTLSTIETAAATGSAVVINGSTTTAERSDIALAKKFFSGLRSNSAALQNGPLDTGLTDGIKAFGDSLEKEAAKVTSATGQALRFSDIAFKLWSDYTSGKTTNPNSVAVSGLSGGCTVYEDKFPVQFGNGIVGEPSVYTSNVVATTASAATWVGCSVTHGTVGGIAAPQFRESLLFNMAASADLSSVPYLAAARKRYTTAGITYSVNLTAALKGTAGFTVDGAGKITSISMVGDLPPDSRITSVAASGSTAASRTGELLAARYRIDVKGTLTELPSGAYKAAFSEGSFGVVPVNGLAESLTLDLSAGGGSFFIAPQVQKVNEQAADATFNLVASIKTAKGELKGTLFADNFSQDSEGEARVGHVKFTGTAAVAPIVNGASGAMVTFLTGDIDVSNPAAAGSKPAITFNGVLTLPNRPSASLKVSIVQTPATANVAESFTLSGSYVQDAVTVAISATQSATVGSATFADSSGVSVSVTKADNTANVTVGGRQTAVIDKASKRITYGDGTFESLI